jgi:diguanylate cyclase (GGDEF)-like protein
LQKDRLSISLDDTNDNKLEHVFSQDVEMKLLALEEASEFFGASLKSADMFRLVSSRIREIVPFASSALFLVNEENTRLKAAFADGENAEKLVQIETDFYKGLAGKTYVSKKSQIDEKLLHGKNLASFEALKNLNSAVSVPLFRNAEVFGVLMLYGKNAKDFNFDSVRLLEAVGTRVAPLFLSTFAFEKSLSNALTDTLTNLPNKRAFYLIAENKLAESQRFRNERPLTILAADIKDFNKINQKYGHAIGDRILAFVAKTVKEQLREMDFLARSAGDEFLAVLPTADEEIAREIIGRIQRAFVSNPFDVSRLEKINLALNYGAASFWKDGETVGQLLQHADLRKQQSKSTQKSKILWFPKEYVN